MWAKISKTKVKKVLYPHCLRCIPGLHPVPHNERTSIPFITCIEPWFVLTHPTASCTTRTGQFNYPTDIGGGLERLSCTASENGRLPAEQIAPRPPRCLPRERPSPSSDRHSRCPSSSPPPPPLSPSLDHRALATCPEQQPQQEPRSSSRS